MEKQAYWLVSKENIHMCSAIVGGIFAIKEQISYHETNQICTWTFIFHMPIRLDQAAITQDTLGVINVVAYRDLVMCDRRPAVR